MTPQRYAEIERIFAATRRMDAGERRAYLEVVGSQDAPLRAEVEALLAGADGAGFLSIPALGSQFELPSGDETTAGAAAVSRAAPVELAAQIGRYRIHHPLGRGGMGEVYEAEQHEPVRRRVALKLIRLGMDTREVTARFESERQALALMNHPNVAAVYDAGLTEQGRPFFVMELVRGQPITKHCTALGLTVPQRLALFLAVCDGIQHAHQKGIIHRDIKPSNILVSHEGTEPRSHGENERQTASQPAVVPSLRGSVTRPKIIDFGVAKAIGQPLVDQPLTTLAHQLVGTPAYMSPEQAERGAAEIDTRTDIYALGVLLYELLVGHTPFDAARLAQSSWSEMLRILREEEPLPPSAHAARSTGAAARELRGDLDWIVLRCLEKDRTRRYESVGALADDVRRHLNHEPVAAGPPTLRYRAGKFARKHRAAVLATGAVGLALLAGFATTMGMYLHANDQRRRAVLAEQEQGRLAQVAEQRRGAAEQSASDAQRSAESALHESRRARAAAEFIGQVFVTADPNRRAGAPDRTIIEAARSAVEELDAGAWRDEPDVELMLRGLLGALYEGHGRFELAEPQYRIAMTLVDAGAGSPRDAAECRMKLGALLREAGDFPGAQEFLEQAVAANRHDADGDLARVAAAVYELGTLRRAQGRFAEAESMLREATALYETAPGDQRAGLFSAASVLGGLYQDVGRFAECEELMHRVLAIGCEIYSPDHLKLNSAIGNLAGALWSQHRSVEAEPLFREALNSLRRTVGDRHPVTISILKNLANCLMDLRRPAEAEPLLHEVIALRRKVSELPQPLLVSDYYSLAILYHSSDRFAEAESAYRTAIDIGRAALGPDHPTVGDCLHNLGVLLYTTGRPAEAEPPAQEAVRVRTTSFGERHFKPAQSRSILGGILTDLQRYDEAEPLLLSAYEVLKDDPPVPKNFLPDCIRRLIKLHETQGRLEPAEQWRLRLNAVTAARP